ncbi:hypothetical protein Tco_1096747, partial [Tanacetum coccineum]
ISLSKKRRLEADLDAVVERGDAEELEILLAGALVGVSLKDGYVADMEEKE